MILNEDYFDDLEIKDEHIIDDINDVDEPMHKLTLEEVKKIPEQYNHCIAIVIKKINRDTTFFQTSLIPRIFKRLDTIFELYDIEHSEYVLTSWGRMKDCDTIVEFGDYQLFCEEYEEDKFINDTYKELYIYAYVNYPKFTYKRAFHFLYTLFPNLYRMDRHIRYILFEPVADYVRTLYFLFYRKSNDIRFQYIDNIDKITGKQGRKISLCDEEELSEEDKREFYYSVFCYFFGKGVKVPYKLLERDVPIKLLEF